MDKSKDKNTDFDKLHLLQNIEKLHMAFIEDLQDKIIHLNTDIHDSLSHHKNIIKTFEEDCRTLQSNHLEEAKQLYSFLSLLNDKKILISDEWVQLLKCQQEDFVKRLEKGVSNLIVSIEEGLHSELVRISKDQIEEIRIFCWNLAEKYRLRSTQKVKDIFINNLKGKLAEESIRRYLGSLVGAVNYEIKVGGDGKVDLFLIEFPDICLQVKCRQGRPRQTFWTINKEEIKANTAIICVLIQEKVTESQDEYNLVICGFIPTQLLDAEDNFKQISIDDLLYVNGLTYYLNRIVSELHQENSVDKYLSFDDNEKIWQLVLEKLPRPSRALLSEHGKIKYINISLSEVKIYFEKPPLARLIRSKIPDLEKAFSSILGKNFSVLLCLSNSKLGIEICDNNNLTTNENEKIWQLTLSELDDSIRSFFESKCTLKSLNLKNAKLLLKDEVLREDFLRKIPRLEDSFSKVLGTKIEVLIEDLNEEN